MHSYMVSSNYSNLIIIIIIIIIIIYLRIFICIKYSNQIQTIFTLLYSFKYSYLMLIIFKQIYLTHRWDHKNTIPGQSRAGSNGNEGVLHIPRAPELEPHYQMLLSIIPTIGFWAQGVLPFHKGCSQCILTPANRVSGLMIN